MSQSHRCAVNTLASLPPILTARLPHPRQVLGWVYVGRVALGLTLFGAVAWVWEATPPATTLAASLACFAAGAVTAVSFWYTRVLQRPPGTNFLYLQVLFDTFLVTWAVHLTGGPQSAFSSLYILVIFAAAVLLPFLGGILIGLLASMLYFAVVVWGAHGPAGPAVLLQIALFATVALITGYLGDRLRQTGAALGEMEAELRQLRLTSDAMLASAERLEAVAELSASLAHEIRNPLASIRSAVEQLGGVEVDPEDGLVLRDLVVRESERLARLLAEFIDFARVQAPGLEPVDFGAVVHEAVQLVRAHPEAEGCCITLRADPEELLVPGAEDLLHRAVLNLVLNAAQWAGAGGRVEVVLERVESDLLSPARGAAWIVRLTVTDDGPGVPPELAEQIFSPFFTRRTGGTGLGLALVQRAVEAHAGALLLDLPRPPEEKGASFTLYLPALPAAEGIAQLR